MATSAAPVEVGTRGTVGSLLKKEIEYFRRIQVDCRGSCVQSHRHPVQEMNSNGSKSWPGFRFLPWRRKKRRGSGISSSSSSSNSVIRPGICSIVEVANSHRFNEIPHFSYRNLRADMEEV